MEAAEFELFDRSVGAATEAHSGPALDTALVDLGWHEAMTNDPHAAISVLFEHQGRVLSTSSALDDVVAGALRTDTDPGTAVVLPGLGRAEPPARQDGGRFEVRGLGTARLLRADMALAVAHGADPPVAALLKTSELRPQPLRGMDPGLGLAELFGAATPAAPTSQLAAGTWHEAVARARLAV
ncbi:MAG TPA: hypothetical protein VEJ21_04705, partial [Acidimicrobiales bacterium]|nr:hypothetical protein [Acidimicrobiales bacterium]